MKQIIYIIIGIIISLSSTWAQTASIPDTNFLAFLKSNYAQTINSKNQLIIAQAKQVSGTLDCSGKNIANLEGIEYFTGVKTFHIESNKLTSIPSLDSLASLEEIIAHDNQLKSLPSLSNNKQLTQLVVFNNQLTSLPDLSGLVDLNKIDAGNNLLTVTPDLTSNVKLQELSLDRNLLTKSPTLTTIDSLTLLQVHENYLSFKELLPCYNYPYYSSNYTLQPQKAFPLSNIGVLLNDSLDLSTAIDTSLTTISYTWYFNGKVIGTETNDSLIIYPTTYNNQGYYYCTFTCSALPGIQLSTDSILVTIILCPSDSNFTFQTQEISCAGNGSLKVNLTSLPSQSYSFTLQSLVTGNSVTSATGLFNNLTEPQYILTAQIGSLCKVTLPIINIPYQECKEAFITPDGDGQNDTYYLSQTGTATIYDRNGVAVRTLTIPAEWDGTSKSGQKVAQGYYAVSINNGADYVKISVLY